MPKLLISFLGTCLSITGAVAQPVLIAEVMYNSAVIGDTDGEWIELYNAAESAVALGGWTIGDESGVYTFDGSVSIASGGFVVLCYRSDPALNDYNEGCDLTYGASASGLRLRNSTETISLRDESGAVVDEVTYGTSGWPSAGDGEAIVFTGAASDDNDDGAYWSVASACEAGFDCTASRSQGSPGTAGLGAVLPVELVVFEAQLDGTAVVLRWETASETNNAGFEIQYRRAEAGSPTWTSTAFVEGHGTTAQPQRYRYRLEELAPDRYRFRLKQLDFDGAFEYSPEVEVAVATPERFVLSPAYPNPFNPQTSFSLAVAQAQHVEVAVYDVLGRQVARLYGGVMEADRAQVFRFDGAELPSGLYLVRVVGERIVASQRITLAK